MDTVSAFIEHYRHTALILAIFDEEAFEETIRQLCCPIMIFDIDKLGQRDQIRDFDELIELLVHLRQVYFYEKDAFMKSFLMIHQSNHSIDLLLRGLIF